MQEVKDDCLELFFYLPGSQAHPKHMAFVQPGKKGFAGCLLL